MKSNFKKNLLGKAISCLTVIVMIAALLPAAFVSAEEVTYAVKGDATLYAPQTGNKSIVPFELQNATTKEIITGATLSLSGDIPNGVSLTSDRTAIILDGTSIKNGSFTVTAEKDDARAEKIVTVADARLYFDFEGQSSSSPADYGTKLSDGQNYGTKNVWTAGNVAGDSTNKYITSGTLRPGYVYTESNATAPRYLTIEFLVEKTSNGSFFKESTSAGTTAELKSHGTDTSNYIAAHENNSSWNKTSFLLSATSGQKKVQVVLDYSSGKYTVFAEENNLGTFTMPSTGNGFAKQIYFACSKVDNIAVYSGIPFATSVATGTISGNDELLAPIDGEKSAVKYVLSNDGTQIDNAVWTLNGAPAGITISNAGVLTMDGTAMNAGGSFTVNAVTADGLLSATKEVKVNDYRYFNNFNSGEVQFNKIKLSDDTAESSGIYFNNSPTIALDGTNYYLAKNGTTTIQAVVKGGSASSNAWKEPNVVTMSFKVKNGGSSISLNGSSVLYIATTGRVGKSADEVTDAYLPANKWAEVRITMDFNKKIYSVWADDCLALKDITIPVTKRTNDNYHGINVVDFNLSIDDLAIYSGEKVTADTDLVDGVIYQDNALQGTGVHSVKAIRSGFAKNGEIPALILAEYNDGILENIEIINLTSGLLGDYTLSGRLDEVEQGHTAKVFLWDMGSLVPVLVESELD